MLKLLTFTIALYLFHLSLGGAQSVLDEAEGYAVRVKASIGYPFAEDKAGTFNGAGFLFDKEKPRFGTSSLVSFKILILFFALSLKLDLNIKIQVESLSPLPTLPRNWWSWESPNLLAFSIIITFAFGKSIPTSIMVVETSIWNFLFKNLFRIFSFSWLSVFPWISATFSGNFFLRYSNFLIL